MSLNLVTIIKLPYHLQIENDLENDSIFSYKSGNGRRASTTNNNNANPVDIVPGSPIAVRSKWVRSLHYIDETILIVIYSLSTAPKQLSTNATASCRVSDRRQRCPVVQSHENYFSDLVTFFPRIFIFN